MRIEKSGIFAGSPDSGSGGGKGSGVPEPGTW
jgi:hypothetical protein